MKSILIILFTCTGYLLSGQQIEKLDGWEGYHVEGEIFPKFEDLGPLFSKDPELNRKFDKYLKIKKRGRVSAGISAGSLVAFGIIRLSDSSSGTSKSEKAGVGFSNFPDHYEALMTLGAINFVSGIVAIQYWIRKGSTKKKLINLYNERQPIGLQDQETSTLKVIASPTGVGLKFSF